MNAYNWYIRRRLFDYLAPKLAPGKHRATGIPALDTPRESCIIDEARFTAWAKSMYPEGVAK